jgi:transposase
LPTLAPGTGKTQKAWLWAYARDDTPFGGTSPPMVAYRFEDSRAATAWRVIWPALPAFCRWMVTPPTHSWPKRKSAPMKGWLSRAVGPICADGSMNCTSTAVRKLRRRRQRWSGSEEEIRGCDAAVRLTARRDRSAAIVADLFKLWETELPRISGKSKLAEAIRYATSRREILGRFLLDGRIEIDSNIVERAIRPQTIKRKNALFAGSHGGGRTWATIATLLQTAKMNDVDPLAWLTQTLERIANRWPISQIDELMPWNYKT